MDGKYSQYVTRSKSSFGATPVLTGLKATLYDLTEAFSTPVDLNIKAKEYSVLKTMHSHLTMHNGVEYPVRPVISLVSKETIVEIDQIK